MTRVKYDSLEKPKKIHNIFFRIFVQFIFGRGEMPDLLLTSSAEAHSSFKYPTNTSVNKINAYKIYLKWISYKGKPLGGLFPLFQNRGKT